MPGPEIDNRKDVILLLLFAPGSSGALNEPIEGRTRLTKLLFLAEKELFGRTKLTNRIPPQKRHKFYAHHYGPFSNDVYDDVVFLENIGLVEERGGSGPTVAEIAEFRLYLDGLHFADEDDQLQQLYPAPLFLLTEKGMEYASQLHARLSNADQREIANFKRKYNSVPLRVLISYVYERYPDFATKSRLKK